MAQEVEERKGSSGRCSPQVETDGDDRKPATGGARVADSGSGVGGAPADLQCGEEVRRLQRGTGELVAVSVCSGRWRISERPAADRCSSGRLCTGAMQGGRAGVGTRAAAVASRAREGARDPPFIGV
jgi:hypothetical protein